MGDVRPSFYLGTSIDGVHIAAEQLNVRGVDLNELIGQVSFTEAVFHILTGRLPNDQERRLFDIVLVAFHGGFGLLPPTTLVPRLVAGTGVTTSQAMASGMLASGPYHVGAIESAMSLYRRIAESFQQNSSDAATAGQLEQYAYDFTASQVEVGQIVGGFGHPLLRKDPRPVHIRRLVCDLGAEGPYLDIYDGISRCMREKKGISPNVDGITGAVLSHLGLLPEHGVGLFLLARSAAMLAHIVEEQTEMPYQTMKRFMLLPVAAPRLFNANFRKIAKRFNVLRDSRIYSALRGVFGRKSNSEAAAREASDLSAIAEFRSRRDGVPVESSALETPLEGRRAESPNEPARPPVDRSEEDAWMSDAASSELLASATLFLSACLRSMPAGTGQESPESRRMEALINAALDLVRESRQPSASS